MKYKKIIIFNLAIIAISAVLYYATSRKTSEPVAQTVLQVQTITDGAVTYTITPKDLTTSATTWDFDVALDTHTESLDQDLIQIIRMVDDRGNEYKAIKWDGAPPGGHHREGTLKFSSLTSRPAFIELNIQTTGDSKETSLHWNI